MAEGIGAKMAASLPRLFDRRFAPRDLVAGRVISVRKSAQYQTLALLLSFQMAEVAASRQMFAHIRYWAPGGHRPPLHEGCGMTRDRQTTAQSVDDYVRYFAP